MEHELSINYLWTRSLTWNPYDLGASTGQVSKKWHVLLGRFTASATTTESMAVLAYQILNKMQPAILVVGIAGVNPGYQAWTNFNLDKI